MYPSDLLVWVLCGLSVMTVCLFFIQVFQKKRRWVWLKRRLVTLRSKKLALSLVFFEFSLLLSTCVPFYRYAGASGFQTYAAFAFPCAAGLVAGGGFFFDQRRRMRPDSRAFVVSAVFMAAGYFVFISMVDFWRELLFWAGLQAVFAISASLTVMFFLRKRLTSALDGLFLPSIIFLLLFGAMTGTAFFYSDASFKPESSLGCNGHPDKDGKKDCAKDAYPPKK